MPTTTAIGPAIAIVCLSTLTLVSCGADEGEDGVHELVIAIDRTGVAQAETWQAEVAAQTPAALETAVTEGVDDVDLIAIGSNTQQAAVVADADFDDIEGNTGAKRDAARQALIEDISSAAAQIAAQPVETCCTDVLAAIHQAASLCQALEVTECSLLIFSDLEDQRVTGASSVEEAVASLTPLMPGLTGVSIEVSGLGASGADAATVEKVRTVWLALFEQAGAVDVRIARSL